MRMVEARRRIWQRLATTARADIDIGDWMYEEGDGSESDARRLAKASRQVALTIERRLARQSARGKEGAK